MRLMDNANSSSFSSLNSVAVNMIKLEFFSDMIGGIGKFHQSSVVFILEETNNWDTRSFGSSLFDNVLVRFFRVDKDAGRTSLFQYVARKYFYAKFSI